MGKKNQLKEVLDLSSKFIGRHPEGWDHTAWEDFVQEVEELGVPLDAAGQTQLGKLLEAARALGTALPAPERKRKETAKAEKKARKSAEEAKPKRKKASKAAEAESEDEDSDEE